MGTEQGAWGQSKARGDRARRRVGTERLGTEQGGAWGRSKARGDRARRGSKPDCQLTVVVRGAAHDAYGTAGGCGGCGGG
ncbi:MAG: hypothetical protein LBD24_09705 [Spirochaetaceae bacterium]|nr:hypothetical protein [Spirochaetaceae bacterium]